MGIALQAFEPALDPDAPFDPLHAFLMQILAPIDASTGRCNCPLTRSFSRRDHPGSPSRTRA